MRTLLFTSLAGDVTAISTWSSEPRYGLAVGKATELPSFSVFLRIWKLVRPRQSYPRPSTQSATQPSTDWANPLNSITIGLYPSRSWWKTTERLQMPPISLSNLKPVRSTRRSISKETKLYLKFRCLGKLLSDLYEHDIKSKCMNSLVQSLELFKYTCQDNCRLTS